MKKTLFRYQFLLVPIALPVYKEGDVFHRECLIFGVRICYWTIKSWDPI